MKKLNIKGLKRIRSGKVRRPPAAAAPAKAAEYERVISRFAKKAPLLQAELERNQARAKERYAGLVDQPEGRRATVIENGQPAMLLALAHDLVKRSYERRFRNAKRSLELALLAYEVAQAIARTDYLSPAAASDLLAETLDHVGNAKRLNSDVRGAEQAFLEAEEQFHLGTQDRDSRATHLAFQGALRYTQGRAREAADLFDKEIALRRLLDDPSKLGAALVNRGLLACWVEDSLLPACRFIREGVDLVEDDRSMFLGLLHLAEAFGRNGDGIQAWKLLCMCRLVGGLAELEPGFHRRHVWVEGITYRALGENSQAEKALRRARQGFLEAEQPLLGAFAALDLLPVLASQGELEELTKLAERTYEEFKAAGLEEPALSVFMILHRAAMAKRLSEELAISVANFVMRYQHDHSLSFEHPEA